MVEFLADTKAGTPEVRAPVYSHRSYDILDGEWQAVTEPDILIFEGLNVLQTGSVDPGRTRTPSVIVSTARTASAGPHTACWLGSATRKTL